MSAWLQFLIGFVVVFVPNTIMGQLMVRSLYPSYRPWYVKIFKREN